MSPTNRATRRTVFLSMAMVLVTAPLVLADQVPSKPPSPEEMQKQMEKMRQDAERMQQQELERLRQIDPKMYEARKSAMDRQAKIGAIVKAFYTKSISAESAESQLTPLIRQDVQAEVAAIPTQIQRLEKRLDFLRKARANPDLLIKKRVDQMLGRGGPPSPDDMGPY